MPNTSKTEKLKFLSVGVLIGASLWLCLPLQVTASSTNLPLEEIHRLNNAFETIKGSYVDEMDDKELINAAIRGMISDLDPHSAYLEPIAYKNLRTSTSGKFGGLGIEVTMENGFVKVVSPIDDTPAFKAGVKAGDLIIRLDELSVKGMSLKEAVDIMRGEPGTDIELTIVRENEGKPIEITITRDIIQITSVRSEMLEDNIVYIRISQFQEPTSRQMYEKIKQYQQKNGRINGLILDLRNNPGGVLSGAIDVAGAFLDEKVVVKTKGRIRNSSEIFKANPGDLLPNTPIIVLINGGSASASEIVAGALQDHRRAIIMGQKSFGKGSVQTVIPLSKKYAMKITTSRYYTPNDRAIQAEGVTPDIGIPIVKVTPVEQIQRFKEKDLSGHLENEPSDDAQKTTTSNKNTIIKPDTLINADSIIEKDYELSQAINTLKALALTQRN